MKINSINFVKGIAGSDPILHDGKNHVVFIGRSNVGKSSVINSIVRKKIAQSSSTPGKTARLNFFLVNNSFYIIDLPGYGFARRGIKHREKMSKWISWYVTSLETSPKIIFLIIDARHGFTESDYEVFDYLRSENIYFFVIANKVDKLNQSEYSQIEKKLLEDLSPEQFTLYSAKTHQGRDRVEGLIGAILKL